MTHSDEWYVTRRRRQPPTEPVEVLAAFAGDETLPEDLPAGPIELTIEATNGEGELAAWFDDLWWTDLVERWGYEALTVRIAPTPAALLDPVVLHEVEMVHRVAPRWRVLGYAYRNDIASPDEIETLACSAYDEVRFLDEPRPGRPTTDRMTTGLAIDELIGEIRREQARVGATRPILVRLPATTAERPMSPAPKADTPAVRSIV